MTIHTRNEVLVSCENTPLMELLEHLVKDHASDLDYCLDELGLTYTAASKPQEVRTQQEFLDLPLGTVMKIPHVGTYYKITSNHWAIPGNFNNAIHWSSDDDMANCTVSINAPATILFIPEVRE